MKRLNGCVALVSGAGTGIGRGVVGRFVQEGAAVVAVGRRVAVLESLRLEYGAAIEPVAADVTEYEDCQRAVETAITRFGRLDIVVPNAGVYDARLRLADADPEALSRGFDELFTVNVKGAMLLVRAAVDALVEHNGVVIFTASVSGLEPGFGGALYVPSKHAVVGLARQLALELAGRVRVNSVALGYVATELAAPPALGGGRVLSDPAAVAPRVPTGRAARPEDIAGVYAMLASKSDGSAITGSVITVDSGQTLWGPGRHWASPGERGSQASAELDSPDQRA
jgi:cis-1,2-dihydro-1,2-dihydroxynaphthalene/dibenzothiophene dihydrodiol dehydrogenase